MKTFGALLYESFLRVNGWLLGGAALVLSITVFIVSPATKVAVGWLIAALATCIVIVVVVVDAASTAWRMSQRGLPKVRRTLDPPKIYVGVIRILIVDPSDLFSVETLISLYVKDDEYERLLGLGRVLTVQSNGILQIGITSLVDADEAIQTKLNGNDAGFLKALLVKPSFPSYLLQEKSDA